jgi:hypothetical protein
MNYEISQGRLNELVDKVMENQLGKLHVEKEKVNLGNRTNKKTYYNMRDIPMVIFLENDGEYMVGLNENVYGLFNNVFGFSNKNREEFNTTQKLLKDWFKRTYNIDVVAVETFEQGQEEYFYSDM